MSSVTEDDIKRSTAKRKTGLLLDIIQEFITPYSPEQNEMIERVIRTLKGQCVQGLEAGAVQHASRLIADWTGLYRYQRTHQALNMRPPAEAYALAA